MPRPYGLLILSTHGFWPHRFWTCLKHVRYGFDQAQGSCPSPLPSATMVILRGQEQEEITIPTLSTICTRSISQPLQLNHNMVDQSDVLGWLQEIPVNRHSVCDRCRSQLKNVELAFAKEWAKQAASSGWRLLRATFASVRWTVLAVVIARFCQSALKLSQPLLIARVTGLQGEGLNDNNSNQAKGLIGAAALIYIEVAITTALYQREPYRMLTKIRGSIVSAVYTKVLQLDTTKLADNA